MVPVPYTRGLHDVGNGHFVWLLPTGTWGYSNAGLVVDGGESLLVDTLFDEKLTGEMFAAMKDATGVGGAELGTVVNTHANGDHTYGNGLAVNANIIASKASAHEIAEEAPPEMLAGMMKMADQFGLAGEFFKAKFGDFHFDGIQMRQPTQTFTGELEVKVGNKTARLIEVGPAHTAGDTLVHVPEDKVVYTGDILFIEGTPIAWAGPVANWIKACDLICAMDVDVIVPGHGPLTDKAGVRTMREYLVFVDKEARARHAAGMDSWAAAQDIALGAFGEWPDAERLAVAVDTIYREINADTSPRDVVGLFGRMAELEKKQKAACTHPATSIEDRHMKLVTYGTGAGALRLGALVDGGNSVLDLVKAAGGSAPAFSSMQALIDAGSEALGEAKRLVASSSRDAVSPLSSVKLAAPLPRPIKARDCSLFLEHMEAAMKKVARQMADADPDPEAKYAELTAPGARFSLNPLFRKKVIYYNCDVLAFSGPEEEIVWPSDSEWMDYELEWACVVGKPGENVKAEKARDHIFGYTIFNDWSARDTQLAVIECNLGPGAGKDFARSNGIGPCIATPDEFEDPYKLTMTARVNGEEWSRGTTGSMHHSFEDAVAGFSRDRMLVPGELIASGTVLSGCGLELGRRLSDGDVVELEIEGIGVLRNRVVRRH